jgi:hypothetical protein
MSLIGLLVALVVIVIVMVAAKYICDYMEAPPPIRMVVLLVAGLFCLIILLNGVGVVGPRLFVW